MSKFVDIIIDFISYESTVSTNSPLDSTKIKLRISESSVSEVFRFQKSIEDGLDDVVIPLPSNNADYLLIFTDQEIEIKINGGAAMTLVPASTKKSLVFFNSGVVTSLTISNNSGSIANVDVVSINL
jgi:hypothetical protein